MVKRIENPHASYARLIECAKAWANREGRSFNETDLPILLESDSVQKVSQWKRRGVSVEGARKAGTALGCDPEYILTGKKSEYPPPAYSLMEALEVVASYLRNPTPLLINVAESSLTQIARNPNDKEKVKEAAEMLDLAIKASLGKGGSTSSQSQPMQRQR